MQKDSLIHLKRIARDVLKCAILPPDTYMAGGTAVSFYLGRRVSVDLDFFSQRKFVPETLLFNLKECFEKVYLEVMENGTLITYLTEDKVKFSMFYLPYPLLKDISLYNLKPGTNCPMASIEDIAAMKSVALAQRGSAKDFFDLYFIINHAQLNFDDIFELVQQKYNLGDNYIYHLKTSFVYFDDAESEAQSVVVLDDKQTPQKMSGQLWNEIKDFFRGYVK